MPYDPIRDIHSESPTIRRHGGLSMVLNDPVVLEPPPATKPRFDPVRFLDNPISPTVETSRPSSSSSSASGYYSSSLRDVSSPAMTSLALPKQVQVAFENHRLRSATPNPGTVSMNNSPVRSPRPLSAVSPIHSPFTSPIIPSRTPASTTMPPPARIPYNPRNRVSAPKSVLVPITPQEVERLTRSSRNPLRRDPSSIPLDENNGREENDRANSSDPATGDGGWSPSRPLAGPSNDQAQAPPPQESPTHGVKRRAGPDDSADWDRMLHPSHRGDAALVAQHYNERPEVGKVKREDSPIIGLKSFNNWIKAVMIAKFARPAIQEANSKPQPPSVAPRRRPRFLARVLDLGCGKGGDLTKWGKTDIALYVGVDIAAVSIEQARARWMEQRVRKFAADFYDMDCFSRPLSEKLPPHALEPFDVVSMQFCMHYAFESEEKARTMISNVANHLRPGGVFIGTIPNAKPLLRRLKKIPADAELTFGNNVYSMRFETRHAPDKSVYGHKYWFYLKDAVDAPEYVVRWDPFVALAAEHGLELLYKEDFHSIYQKEQEPPEFKALLQTMRVVDSKGESSLDQDQWEAANIYIGFAFKKKAVSEA